VITWLYLKSGPTCDRRVGHCARQCPSRSLCRLDPDRARVESTPCRSGPWRARRTSGAGSSLFVRFAGCEGRRRRQLTSTWCACGAEVDLHRQAARARVLPPPLVGAFTVPALRLKPLGRERLRRARDGLPVGRSASEGAPVSLSVATTSVTVSRSTPASRRHASGSPAAGSSGRIHFGFRRASRVPHT